MSNVLVNEASLQNVASAIRSKNETQNTYTPSQMAQAILDIPTGGSYGTKVITYNGTFNAEDDNLDGYSEVTVSRDPNLHPISTDITNGYVNSSTFTIGSGYYSDVYIVEAGHNYLFEYGGSNYGNLFRILFTSVDTTNATSNISGTSIANSSGSSSSSAKWTATSDGYVTITKSNSASGKKSYVFDITLAEDL